MKHTRVFVLGGGRIGRRLAEYLTGQLLGPTAVALVDDDEATLDRATGDLADGRRG